MISYGRRHEIATSRHYRTGNRGGRFYLNSHHVVEVVMWKNALVVATALALAGSSVAYAQQNPGQGDDRDSGRRWQFSQEDADAFLDARLAALHAGLKLTPDQEKNWPAFEQAYRDMAKLRGEPAPRTEPSPANPIERLQRWAEALTTHGAALKRLADAAAPLYQSLDDAQKHRFAVLSRPLRGHGMWGGQYGQRSEGMHMRGMGMWGMGGMGMHGWDD
jgi:zinc resistance-associated protein